MVQLKESAFMVVLIGRWVNEIDGVVRKGRAETESEKVEGKKEKLQDEVRELGIATTETMFEMKENNTDKKLMLTL
ncbi:Golgi apparatus membrane protein TVP23, partial [Bienertia sinuspersici]